VRCIARVLSEPRTTPRSESSGAAAARNRRPEARLLLVEDNPANQRVASLLLAKMGYAVDVAANGQAALEMLASKPFDLVLMDCQMPVLDGYEATRRIRTGKFAGINPRVPIVALTAYARAEDRARCLNAGMDAYVSKPIRADELERALAQCGLVSEPEAKQRPQGGSVVIDADVLAATRALRGIKGSSLLPELVELYQSEEAERLERMERQIKDRDADALAADAHSFGGNAASFGAVEVRRVALELEDFVRDGAWPEAEARMAALRGACERLRAELQRLSLDQR
jgi:CheY-like chemotaxis protein